MRGGSPTHAVVPGARAVVRGLLLTLLCAAIFMVVKAVEYREKFHHHTIVATADAEVTAKAKT